jgi:hypothetical protein
MHDISTAWGDSGDVKQIGDCVIGLAGTTVGVGYDIAVVVRIGIRRVVARGRVPIRKAGVWHFYRISA